MPYSTVERVDCTVAEQYNSPLRGESTLSTECSPLAGRTSGDRRHNGEQIIFDRELGEVHQRHYGKAWLGIYK